MTSLDLKISPPVTNAELNTLFATAWAEHTVTDFQPILRHSLLYVCAYNAGQLVGYINVAWDGNRHAFLLDTTVHADFQRRGIGAQLVAAAANAARERGIEWLHVDYEPHLTTFYQACGFQSTNAGLLNLFKG